MLSHIEVGRGKVWSRLVDIVIKAEWLDKTEKRDRSLSWHRGREGKKECVVRG